MVRFLLLNGLSGLIEGEAEMGTAVVQANGSNHLTTEGVETMELKYGRH